MSRNILLEKVIKKGNCAVCGTCIGVCPVGCLQISKETLEPSANDIKCIDCGLCLKICPGFEIDYAPLYEKLFKTAPDQKQHYGCYQRAVFAQAKDVDINNCAGGGVVSSLVKFLLDEKKVQGVICAGYSDERPWVGEAKLLLSSEQINKVSGSKYVCIPVNAQLKNMLKPKGKYAVVGVPCAIEALRKLQLFENAFWGKIYLTIGIFCGINVKQTVTEKLLDKMKIARNKIRRYSNRDKVDGYLTKIMLSDGETVNLSKIWGQWPHLMLSPYYSPRRCQICTNLTNQFADIAVGDTWSKKDFNLVLARTDRGVNVWGDYLKKDILYTEDCEFNHTLSIINKKIAVRTLLEVFGRKERDAKYYQYLCGITENYRWRLIGKIQFMFFRRLFNNPLFKKIYLNFIWKTSIALELVKKYHGWWQKQIIGFNASGGTK